MGFIRQLTTHEILSQVSLLVSVHLCVLFMCVRYAWIHSYKCVCMYIHACIHTQIGLYQTADYTWDTFSGWYSCIHVCIYICIHMCKYICINMCVCVYIYIYIHGCIHTHTWVSSDSWLHMRFFLRLVFLFLCICVCYLCVYAMHEHIHINVCVCIDMHTHIHTHVHTHIHTHGLFQPAYLWVVVSKISYIHTHTCIHTYIHTYILKHRYTTACV
jgi:hypothetical protein